MMKKLLLSLLFMVSVGYVNAQQYNIKSTNLLAEQIMRGLYDPALYNIPQVSKADMVTGLINNISTDSLKSYIEVLGSFYNRNTCSDTVSNTRGIGAARRWVYKKFQEFSAQNQNRLISSYLQFDDYSLTCSFQKKQRNIFTVLPGSDTIDKSVIIIEAHIDSRCEGVYDIGCKAMGIEDNASGTALVMELARVMSKYSFNRTIVFLITTGEEQGLIGATAFAQYTKNKGIKVKAVQNNDVIGGVYCGKTASPPTDCIGNEGSVDSTHVRIFSLGDHTSTHKAFARFINHQYKEEVLPLSLTVPMAINIMIPLDRTGRGGDHQPFSDRKITALRFSAEHEHGDANPVAGYTDRQHSTRDTMGVDTDLDGKIDSFFVDYNYLKRNAVINGNAAIMAAIGPNMPAFIIYSDTLEITAQTQYEKYKISIRKDALDYNKDTIITFTNSILYKLPKLSNDSVFISLASVDSNEVESLFTTEKKALYETTITPPVNGISRSELRKMRVEAYPNPAKYLINIRVSQISRSELLRVVLFDISGKKISEAGFKQGQASFDCSNLEAGIYTYSIFIDKEIVKSDKVLVAK